MRSGPFSDILSVCLYAASYNKLCMDYMIYLSKVGLQGDFILELIRIDLHFIVI